MIEKENIYFLFSGLKDNGEVEERQEVREVQGPFPAGPDVL